MAEARQLSEQDLLAYDFRPEVYRPLEDSYRGALASAMTECIRPALGRGPWTFLDIGGGSGVLSDYLLERFPAARGTLIDTSAQLLARNRPDERKTLLRLSAEEIGARLSARSFDLVCCHCLLHHIVDGSYESSGQRVHAILSSIRSLLKPGGCLSILEHCYDGRLADSLPGRLIFQLTSARRFARVCRRMGAHTAGVGVRFLSRRQWIDVLAECGFHVERIDANPPKRLPWLIKYGLCIRAAQVAHFWSRPEGDDRYSTQA